VEVEVEVEAVTLALTAVEATGGQFTSVVILAATALM
jgi:hypothetical protein